MNKQKIADSDVPVIVHAPLCLCRFSRGPSPHRLVAPGTCGADPDWGKHILPASLAHRSTDDMSDRSSARSSAPIHLCCSLSSSTDTGQGWWLVPDSECAYFKMSKTRHVKHRDPLQTPAANSLPSKVYLRDTVNALIVYTLWDANPKVKTHSQPSLSTRRTS